MKLKFNPPTSKLFGVINWEELGKQLWAAVKPVLLAAIGISTGRRPQLLLALASCGIVTVAAGCRTTDTAEASVDAEATADGRLARS